MDHFSTVLQRPSQREDDDDDGGQDRRSQAQPTYHHPHHNHHNHHPQDYDHQLHNRHHNHNRSPSLGHYGAGSHHRAGGRDILNPDSGAAPSHQHSPPHQHHQHHSQYSHHSFSLRSPPQPEYHHQPPPQRPQPHPRSVAHYSQAPSSHHASPPALHGSQFTHSPGPSPTSGIAPPPAHQQPVSSSASPIGQLGASARQQGSPPLRGPAAFYDFRPVSSVSSPARAPALPQETHHSRAMSSSRGAFYDPLTDTAHERRDPDVAPASRFAHSASASASPPVWASSSQGRDSYRYSAHPKSIDDHQSPQQPSSHAVYRANNNNNNNNNDATGADYAHSSPIAAPLSRPPRSPRSQAQTQPATPHVGSISPPSGPLQISSPGAINGSRSLLNSEPVPLAPPKAALATMASPGRTAAHLMSFSNILSSSADPAPHSYEAPPLAPPRVRPLGPENSRPPATPTVLHHEDADMDVDDDEKASNTQLGHEPEPPREKKERKKKDDDKKDKAAARKAIKPRPSNASLLDTPATAKGGSRRASVKKEPSPRLGAKRQANGQPKTKPAGHADSKERKLQVVLVQMENHPWVFEGDLTGDEDDLLNQRAEKRLKLAYDSERRRWADRRNDLSRSFVSKLEQHAELGRRRYEDIHYEEALREVRDRELYAEKERKKDMQRKRRREKSMAATMEAKAAALARAERAETESERQKHLREAERATKKAQQTQLVLEKGIKGPARSFVDLQLDGGSHMSTFQLSDLESTPAAAKGKRARSGNRPKKSKEQKKAEMDKAAAAQAALDAGEELPTKEEARAKIKLTLKASKSKSKDKEDEEEKEKEEKKKEPEKKGKVKSKDKAKQKKKEKEKELASSDDVGAEVTEADRDQDEAGVRALKEKESKEPKELKEPKPRKEDKPEEPKDKFSTKGYNQIYDQIWRDLARKDVYKTAKMAAESYSTKASNLKKTAILASKEAKRWQLRTNKGIKDQQARAKRVMRDMMTFWKRNEREERDLRKAAEKQELENARKEEADREAARQKRKLNFLISQTELYSHFIGKKIKTDEVERSTDHPDVADKADGDGSAKAAEATTAMDIDEPTGPIRSKVTNFENLDFDAEDETALRQVAVANAQNAIAEAQKKARDFNKDAGALDMDDEGEMNFQNPTGLGDVEIEQPKLLNAQLKEYQLKGLNWLVNLYEQGINGILADEMGLGKTVQSISVMAYLAEKYDVWGPFLVVAPASTLHNWEQEIRKFVPEFKILPYWGSAADRKVLRKFWDRKQPTYKKEASFHVCVTSYQMVVSDVAYFQKMKWQYMILDEAQAIKSSASSRWKCLLSFHCRNRLLLTGTPIQNNMQELWALLHFIMPSLFDSHDEFSEWFSKDIESHATSNTKLNEDQLKRLHMILKPFMLRRVKKHVQKELGDKIELDVFCNLTYRQRAYYANLRNQISVMDLIEKATMGDDNDSGTLMNLVMQFRKVCNHPDLFERADTKSPLSFGYFAETASFVREGSSVAVGYTTRNLIEYELPRRVWTEGGRLHKAGRDNDRAGWCNKALAHMMNIWEPEHLRESTSGSEAFSWLRFADTSIDEVSRAGRSHLFARAVDLAAAAAQRGGEGEEEEGRLGRMAVVYDDDDKLEGGGGGGGFTPAHAMFQVQARRGRRALANVAGEGILHRLMHVSREVYAASGVGRLEQAGRPAASAPPIEVVCPSPATGAEKEDVFFNTHMRKALFGPDLADEKALVTDHVSPGRFPPAKMLPAPDKDKSRFNSIVVPSMRHFIQASGKLAKLDELLFKLKNEGHRVLLYFQMTRMIDLVEEYLTYRNYKYCRLDGSTKLEDRRDTVADFQTRPEIFIFLLSTRAGGLGINLTTADTVIFYDSDWNPTIDSQAMDRAHRLGQTKQVTVYRLITRGTIEERIRKRAMQKEEVQRVVIQGGGASVDFSGRRPAENRNRDIAMWLADDEQAAEIERREKEMLESGEYDKLLQKKKGGKRKRGDAGGGGGVSLDEMYHEGEGHFDDGNGANGAKGSGTATPAGEAEGGKGGAKKRRVGGKKAKTAKQRLAMADGEVD